MGGGTIKSNHLLDEPLTIRAAAKADLDSITHIVQAAFPDDPGCDYKFPYRYEYPNDFLRWTRLEYEEYLDQPDKFAVLVATAPVVASDDGSIIDEPIAIGVWDIAVETKAKGGDRGINERCDANVQHMVVYAETMSRAFTKYFAAYGKEQLHLWMLLTHPDFRRRGAGTMLCTWGQEESVKRGGWILTVMASPMGKILYKHLGYKLIGSETVEADGEDEKVSIDILEKTIK